MSEMSQTGGLFAIRDEATLFVATKLAVVVANAVALHCLLLLHKIIAGESQVEHRVRQIY